MKKLNLILALFLLMGSSTLNASVLDDFMMVWHYTDATGTDNYGIHKNVCVGDTIYIKNVSIYNAPGCTGNSSIPIGNNLTTGTYTFKRLCSGQYINPIGYSQVTGADWPYGGVLAFHITQACASSPLNFTVQHHGQGVTPGCPTARYRTGRLNSYNAQQVTANASPIQVCSGDQVTLTATGSGNYQWSTGQSGSPVNTYPTSTTTYTVNATDANGCKSSDQIEVLVLKKPKLSLDNHYLCQNDPWPTLNAGIGGMNYEWHLNTPSGPIIGSGQYFTPNAYGTYCCIKTGFNGCSSVDCSIIAEDVRVGVPADFTLTVAPASGSNLNVTATMPALPAGYGFFWQVDELDPVTNAVLSSYVNPSLWWNYPTYLTFPGYTFLKNHKYRITRGIWSHDGCLQWKQVSQIVFYETKKKSPIYPIGDVDTGIDIEEAKRTSQLDKDNLLEFTVYPNPSTGVFNISSEDEIESIEVVDITGKVVYKDTPNAISTSFDLSNFGKGTYFVKVQSSESSQTEMIQVK